MIAAKNQRADAFLQRLQHHGGDAFAGLGDLPEIFCLRFPGIARLSDGYRHIPAIAHQMPQGLEPSFQPGDPDCGRPHVNAAAGLAQIERDAKNADLTGRESLDATV
jgi:hypothetical protein